jgi:proteasome beta subunit
MENGPMRSVENGGTGAAMPDFTEVLRRNGVLPEPAPVRASPGELAGEPLLAGLHTHATTILAFKFCSGVLVAGDRRATAGNLVVYDRADKVLEIDRFSLMAIAGVPATAWEMARTLEHSFQFYRRSQLQEMSMDGKVRALSKLLRDNLGMAMQGVGVVVPLFAAYDTAEAVPRLYFYDVMGAKFEVADFAASGSGSPSVRAVLQYSNAYGPRPLAKMNEEEAVLLALRALDTAAENDTATGGVDRHGRGYPLIKIVNHSGITTLPDPVLVKAYQRDLQSLPKNALTLVETE